MLGVVYWSGFCKTSETRAGPVKVLALFFWSRPLPIDSGRAAVQNGPMSKDHLLTLQVDRAIAKRLAHLAEVATSALEVPQSGLQMAHLAVRIGLGVLEQSYAIPVEDEPRGH